MSKIGRNDPCPCGSGKKYKKCCLAKDEEAQQAARQKEMADAKVAQEQRISEQKEKLISSVAAPEKELRKTQKLKLAEKKRKAFWGNFNAADYEGKIAIFMEELDDTGWMCRDVAFDMLKGIHHEAIKRKDWRKLSELVGILNDRLPKLYKAERHYYLRWQIEDLVCAQQWDLLEPLVIELAKVAYREIDQFSAIQDCLAYYGQLPVLAKAMRIAWPKVKKSEHIMRWAVEEFVDNAILYEIFGYLESIPTLNGMNEAEILEQVSYYTDVKAEWLSTYVDYLTGRLQKNWTLDDFRFVLSPKSEVEEGEEDDDFEASPKRPQEDNPNLAHLVVEFLGYLHREKGVPYTKAEMASSHIRTYIFRRHAGELEYRESMLQAMMREYQGQPEPKRPQRKVENILCPDHETLERYMDVFYNMLNSRPYAASAMVELLPEWLKFLESRQLLAPELYQSTWDSLQQLQKDISKVVGKEWDGALLVAEIKRRWEK